MTPSESEHETAVARIVDYAEEAELNPSEPKRDDGDEDNDFITQFELDMREGQVAFLLAPFGGREFHIVYPYDLAQTVSNSLSEKDLKNIEPEDSELDVDDSYEAAIRVLAQTPDHTLEELRRSTHVFGTSQSVTVNTRGDHGLLFSRYDQRTYVYPFDENFGYRSFVNSFLSLSNMSKRTREWIQGSIRIVTPEETDADQYQLSMK